jgi:hypothetical protein
MADPQQSRSFPSSQRYGVNMREPKPLKDLEWLHRTLEWAGMGLPVAGEAFDLIDAGIYAIEGRFKDAGISLAAALPFAGVSVSVARKGKRLKDASDAGKKLAAEATDLAKRAKEADLAGNTATANKLAKQARDAAGKRKQKVDKEFNEALKEFDSAATPVPGKGKVRQGLEPVDTKTLEKNIFNKKEFDAVGPGKKVTGPTKRKFKNEAKKEAKKIVKDRDASVLNQRAATRDVDAARTSSVRTFDSTASRPRVDFGRSFDDFARQRPSGPERLMADAREAVAGKPFNRYVTAGGLAIGGGLAANMYANPPQNISDARQEILAGQKARSEREERDKAALNPTTQKTTPKKTTTTPSQSGGGLIKPEGQRRMEEYSRGVAPKQTPAPTSKPTQRPTTGGSMGSLEMPSYARGVYPEYTPNPYATQGKPTRPKYGYEGTDNPKTTGDAASSRDASPRGGSGSFGLRNAEQREARIKEGRAGMALDTPMTRRTAMANARRKMQDVKTAQRGREQFNRDTARPQVTNPYRVGPAPDEFSSEFLKDIEGLSPTEQEEAKRMVRENSNKAFGEDDEKKARETRERRRRALDLIRGRKRGSTVR